MASRASIGVDIGGTKTLFVLFDESFRAVETVKIKTPLEKGEKGFTEGIVDGVEDIARAAKKKNLVVVVAGAGCAGVLDRDEGRIRFSPNITYLKNYPLAKVIAKASGVDAFIDNDVRMGLYGEHRLGAARGLDHVIGVFFGTGVGGAAIVGGELLHGANGLAGEIGHYLISPLGALSGWERHGVLDDFVSRSAMAGEAAALALKRWAPNLHDLVGADAAKIRSGTLAKAIRLGDRRIEDMVRGRARMAGIAISNLVDFLDPQMVVLGGGLVDCMPKLFLHEVGEGVRRNVVPEVRRSVRIAASKLKERAVAAGAAKMAWDRLLAAAPSQKGDKRVSRP